MPEDNTPTPPKADREPIDLVQNERGFLIPHFCGKPLPGAQKVVVTNDIAVRYAEITLRVFLEDLTIDGRRFAGLPGPSVGDTFNDRLSSVRSPDWKASWGGHPKTHASPARSPQSQLDEPDHAAPAPAQSGDDQ